MVSKKTVEGIVRVLTEEVGTPIARKIASRLMLVQGNQSYFQTMLAVRNALHNDKVAELSKENRHGKAKGSKTA